MKRLERLISLAFGAALELKARLHFISQNKKNVFLGDWGLIFNDISAVICERKDICVTEVYGKKVYMRCKANGNDNALYNTFFTFDESSCIAKLVFNPSGFLRHEFVFTPILTELAKAKGKKQSDITINRIFEDAAKGKDTKYVEDYVFICDIPDEDNENEELLRLIANCCHVCEKVNTFLSDALAAGETPGDSDTFVESIVEPLLTQNVETQIGELKIGDCFYLSESALGTGENVMRGKIIEVIFVNQYQNELLVTYEGSGVQSWQLDNVIKGLQNGEYVLCHHN